MATVLPIAVICYLAGIGVKAFGLNKRYIPLIVGVLGGILGAVGYFTMKSFPAGDLLTGVAVGVMSGLASTGLNETIKTITQKNCKTEDHEDDSAG